MRPVDVLRWLVLATSVALVCSDGIIIKNDHENTPVQVSAGKYRIPNPFDLQSLDSKKTKEEFYYFKSTQTSFEARKRSRKLVVEEYFSLGLGLSYSLHRDINKPEQEWAIIGDSARSRFYVVRNPHAAEPDEIDCELDHAHNQRHVFPWQFLYELSPATTADSGDIASDGRDSSRMRKKQKKRTKAAKPKKAFVYGVGAIWLNAITLDIRSNQVDDGSNYASSNSWSLAGRNGLKVELRFEKLSEEKRSKLEGDSKGYQKLLDGTKLDSIRVDRSGLVENPLTGDAPHGNQFEHIVLQDYRHGLKMDSEPELGRFGVLLEQCRKNTKSHRLFPSLLRSLSTSAGQNYRLHYITQRFSLYKMADGRPADGKYDQKRRRATYPMEFVTEVFSLAHEAQMKIYSPLPLKEGRHDAFIDRFTERANNQRSSRHSSAHYHIIEFEDDPQNARSQCKVGEHELLPDERLFVRPLTFERQTSAGSTAEYHAHLTGLGALLMNAADMHYKSFSLTGRTIRVAQDPNNLDEFRYVYVDEWSLVDKSQGWHVTFYFEERDRESERLTLDLTDRARGDLSRLVQVDIRTTTGIEAMGETDVIRDEEDDSDLLLRFTIANFEFDADEEDIEFLLTPPDICASGRNEPLDSDSDSDSDADSHYDDPDFYNTDRYMHNYSSDEETSDDNDEDERQNAQELEFEQQQGEQFELKPGMMHEDLEMPDLIELLDGGHAYEILTKILFEPDDEEEGGAEGASRPQSKVEKQIWLRELVNLKHEFTVLKIYDWDRVLKAKREIRAYYIFYEFELMFTVANEQCSLVEDVDEKWLRLFSSQMKYYTLPDVAGRKQEVDLIKSNALIESSKLSLYGMGALWRRASESPFTAFLGKKRRTLELDGRKYRELVWGYQEHDMDFHFHFLEDLSQLEQDKKDDKHQPAHKYLKLHRIELKNESPDDRDEASAFGKIRAELEEQVIGKAANEEFDPGQDVPECCNRQYWDACRKRRQTIEGTKPPSFAELAIGKGSLYKMIYSIEHEVLDGAEGKSGAKNRAEVVESFDREKNLGKMEVKKENQLLTLYIDGSNKRIYAHLASSQDGEKCTLISSIAPIFSEAVHLDLSSNPEFDPDKLYGLANLINEFSKIDAKLHVEILPRFHGKIGERHEYKLHLDGGSPGKHEPQEITLKFYKERERLQVADAPNKVIEGCRARLQRQLELNAIYVQPAVSHDKSSSKFKMPFYKSRIVVFRATLQPDAKIDWQLPAACKALASNVPANPTNTDDTGAKANQKSADSSALPVGPHQFPDLETLMERVNLFHMKSEVSIQGALEKVYLLEEWSHNNQLRVRSQGLGKAAQKDFDFVIYGATKEQFDLSRPFSCKKNKFPENPLGLDFGKELQSNLLQVWADGETLINHLANSYYSPLTLWRQAQKSSTKKLLLNEFQITSLPKPGQEPDQNVFGKLFERDLERETWLVGDPQHDPSKWSYKMDFVRKSRTLPDGRLDTWHILQGISLLDFEPISFGDDNIYNEHPTRRFNVFIDVLDYHYKSQVGQILDTFLLPEGWGCQRDAAIVDQLESYDELRLSEQDNWLLAYEASLELITEAQAGNGASTSPSQGPASREMLPTASGLFLRTGLKSLAIQPEMDICTHHSQIRRSDGQTLARRLVLDRSKSMEYEIDKSSGFCTIALVRQPGWQLVFPQSKTNSSKSQLVNLLSGALKQSLFRELFLETAQQDVGSSSATKTDTLGTSFYALNQFSLAGRSAQTSYEREVESLQLTAELVGPARIVRKFSQQQFRFKSESRLDGKKVQIKRHDDVTTRVFLFDQTKTKLRAVLHIHLERRPEPSLSLMLAEAQVRQCFNDGTPQWDEEVRTFTLEYSSELIIKRHLAYFNEQLVRDEFYARLMKATGLLSLQLDGAAQVGLAEHENLFRIHFSVMEAPTSYVYFKELAHCTMEEEFQMKSESRIAPSLLECSRWCDQTNCAAMSYCFDHVCRVVTARAVFGQNVSSLSSRKPLKQTLSADQLHRLSSCKPDNSCSYYFQNRGLPRPTLARLRQFMDRAVNQERDATELEKFSISLGFGAVRPLNFYEYGEQYRGRADDTDPNDVDKAARQADEKVAIGWGQDRHSIGLIERNKKLDHEWIENTYSAHHDEGLISVVNHANTIAECFNACDRFNCLILSHCAQGAECLMAAAKNWFADIGPAQRQLLDAPGCSVYTRDHLSSFQKYEATWPPGQSDKRIEDVPLLVCAAMCKSAGESCLSFDFCSFTHAERKDGLRTACMMQKSHVSLDSFDRAVMLPQWDDLQTEGTNNLAAGKRPDCDHYSKNLLADFRQLANRKLTDKKSGLIRGINEERCAATCVQDERCRAFEFCRNDRHHPSQSCYLARRENLAASLDAASEPTQEEAKQISEKLAKSKTCSVYLSRKVAQADRLEHTFMLAGQRLDALGPESGSSPSRFLSALVWLFGAISLGAVIQFAHIKLTNRPLIFDEKLFL